MVVALVVVALVVVVAALAVVLGKNGLTVVVVADPAPDLQPTLLA